VPFKHPLGWGLSIVNQEVVEPLNSERKLNHAGALIVQQVKRDACYQAVNHKYDEVSEPETASEERYIDQHTKQTQESEHTRA
jgi:hypothetical protein